MKVTEAMLVARGQGLMEVKIPSQKAVKITNIENLLFGA